jgi:DNA-binding transcriptional regulator of glucitol operon
VSRKLTIFVVCVLSLAVCCGLAWWQWERYSSAGGSFQNLGYVLQWPLFGLFPAFMFWRIRTLARQKRENEESQVHGGDSVGVPADVPPPRVPSRPAVPSNPDEDDPELAAYNRYLAELHTRDQQNLR